MYSEIQRHQDVSLRTSQILVATAVTAKQIVQTTIFCLISNPMHYTMHHITSSPYSKYTEAHGKSDFNHRMMINNSQVLKGSNSSLSQQS
jgi:hypothetical protein